MMTTNSALVVALVLTLSGLGSGDVFTAVTELGDILMTDAQLIKTVDQFVKTKEMGFERLKQ
jgi:hypothetical protein